MATVANHSKLSKLAMILMIPYLGNLNLSWVLRLVKFYNLLASYEIKTKFFQLLG